MSQPLNKTHKSPNDYQLIYAWGLLVIIDYLESEQRLLLWTSRIVAEAPVYPNAEPHQPSAEPDPFQLSLSVLQIWTKIFKGNTSWRLVNILGESLELLVSMMQDGFIWTGVMDKNFSV